MKKYFAIIALSTGLISSPAFAHTNHVEEPEVDAGKIHIHNISAGNFDDDDSFGNELELEYGVNDWLGVKLAHVMGGHEGEDYDWYTGGEVAVKFELLQEGEYRPATSIQTSYDWHAQSEHPENIGVMGIFRKNIGPTNNLLNVKLSHNIGENSEGGIDFDAAARSVYEFSHDYAIGAEYFGEFGQIDDMEEFNQQGHQLGPIVTFAPFENVHMHGSLAYLFGISEEAPDGTLKLEVGFEL